jgi:hypothetical protein
LKGSGFDTPQKLQNGDVLYVPPKKETRDASDFIRLLPFIIAGMAGFTRSVESASKPYSSLFSEERWRFMAVTLLCFSIEQCSMALNLSSQLPPVLMLIIAWVWLVVGGR